MNEYYSQANQLSKADFISRVMGYLGVGLGLNVVGAYFGNLLLPALGSYYPMVMLVLLVAQLAMAFMIGRNLETRSTNSVRIMFVIYSTILGLTISAIISQYTSASVFFAFGTTAVVFISLCVIGRTTNLDLSRFGNILRVGLIVCIIVTLLNFFILRASMVETVLTYFETLLFMGLIAYDMQMIDRYYANSENENLAIYAALQLELDFINLLIRVLEIFGRRRDD